MYRTCKHKNTHVTHKCAQENTVSGGLHVSQLGGARLSRLHEVPGSSAAGLRRSKMPHSVNGVSSAEWFRNHTPRVVLRDCLAPEAEFPVSSALLVRYVREGCMCGPGHTYRLRRKGPMNLRTSQLFFLKSDVTPTIRKTAAPPPNVRHHRLCKALRAIA